MMMSMEHFWDVFRGLDDDGQRRVCEFTAAMLLADGNGEAEDLLDELYGLIEAGELTSDLEDEYMEQIKAALGADDLEEAALEALNEDDQDEDE